MKLYTKYMIAMLAAAFAVACHSDINNELVRPNVERPAIVLDISGGVLGVDTRAEDMADNEREFAINHLDVMIFNDAAADEDRTLFYHERVAAAGPEGRVALGVDVDAIVAGAKYWVYVVANSTADASTFSAIGNVKNLVGLTQSNYSLHLTGTGLANTPSRFLMDGVAYMGAAEPTTPAAITITEGQINDVVTL